MWGDEQKTGQKETAATVCIIWSSLGPLTLPESSCYSRKCFLLCRRMNKGFANENFLNSRGELMSRMNESRARILVLFLFEFFFKEERSLI